MFTCSATESDLTKRVVGIYDTCRHVKKKVNPEKSEEMAIIESKEGGFEDEEVG